MKKIVLTVLSSLVVLSTAQGTEYTVCDGINCEKREIFFEEEKKGSGLLNFDPEHKDKLAAPTINPGDETPKLGAPRRSMDLRFRDLSPGVCLIDPIAKNPVYYKIMKTETKERNQVVYYVTEAEKHENALKSNFIFFNSRESGAFRKLRKISCEQTPHLFDDNYIKKCRQGSQVGTHLCDYDRFVR